MKTFNKYLLLTLSLLLALAPLAACDSGGQQAPSSVVSAGLELDVHFENTEQGFSFDVPSAWINKLQDDAGTTYAYFEDPVLDDIAVVVQKSAYAGQFQTLSNDELIEFFKEESGGYMDILSIGDVVIDGQAARKMTYIMDYDEEENRKRVEYVYDAGHQAIEITFFALESQFPAYESTFDAIIASFKIIE